MKPLQSFIGIRQLASRGLFPSKTISKAHRYIYRPSTTNIIRLSSNLTPPQSQTEKILSKTSQKQPLEKICKNIPGETEQSNSILSRLPSFPLRSTQTLARKPGVPTSANTNLRTMLEILNKKAKPELIYEAEPHKLYFFVCGVMAFIFSVYGLSFTDWGFRAVWNIYLEDDDILMFLGRVGMCSMISGVAMGVVYASLSLPTRLIRRIWYIPANKKTGSQALIKFTSHPLLPGGTTPVYKLPLESLQRSHRSKIFTRNGEYGTYDRSTFFFLLKDSNSKLGYWMVDRNGWFWGDGRIFDVLFGKETIEEAEKGQSYTRKLKEANEKLKEYKQKKNHFENSSSFNKEAKKDIKDIIQIVKGQQKVSPKKDHQ